MVTSPIPFTDSFKEKVKEEILKQNLAEEMKQEKELAQKLEENYRAWSEEKLKGCPQFMRKFSSTILGVEFSWGRPTTLFRFETKQKVCMVPGYTENSDYPKDIQIHSDHPLFSSFVALKRLRDKLNIKVFSENFSLKGERASVCAKEFVLHTTEGDEKFVDKMVIEYITTTKQQLNDFILGKLEEPEKTGTWVQLELF